MDKRKVIINNSAEISNDSQAIQKFLDENCKKGEALLSTDKSNEALYGYKGNGEIVKFISENSISNAYAKKSDIKAQEQANWTETDETSVSYIKNKPSLGTAATKDAPENGDASEGQVVLGNDSRLLKDGEREKLSGIEKGAQVNVKPDWNAAEGDKAEILNKPSIPSNASEIAFDGEHADASFTGKEIKTSVVQIEEAIIGNKTSITGINKDIDELKNAQYDGEVSVDQTVGDAKGSVTITNNDGKKHFAFSFSGIKGKDGIIGSNGKSAYEIAQNNGFEGTEADWLTSLKGDQGTPGEQGVSVSGVDYTASSADGGENKFKVKFSNNTKSDEFVIKNGSKGDQGVSVSGIEYTPSSADSGENKFNVKFSNGTTSDEFVIRNGSKGEQGDAAGFGTISAVIANPTADEPKVEVGTTGDNTAKNITFTFYGLKGEPGTGITVKASKADCTQIGDTYIDADGNLWLLESFNESNEAQFRNCGKIKGPNGNDGRGIASVTSTESTEDGGTSVYTFTYTDNTTLDIKVKNGKAGTDGVTPHIGDNGNWFIGETDTEKPARGEKGDTGSAFVPTVTTDGELSWEKVDSPKSTPESCSIRGPQGERGYYFTPVIKTNGDLSWQNNGGLDNPPSVNIKGDAGTPGSDGVGISSITYTSGDTNGGSNKIVFNFTDNTKSEEFTIKNGSNGKDFTYDDFTEEQLAALKGQQGDPGANGVTPQIGDNGNWYIGTTDTGKPSRGEKGETGATYIPTITATATVSNTTGTPSVTVTSDNNINPTFKFEFSGLKGNAGPQGESADKIDITVQFASNDDGTKPSSYTIYYKDVSSLKWDTFYKDYLTAGSINNYRYRVSGFWEDKAHNINKAYYLTKVTSTETTGDVIFCNIFDGKVEVITIRDTEGNDNSLDYAVYPIVSGVSADDKILRTDENGNILSATLSLTYDDSDKKIKLFGTDASTPISVIDSSSFVTDSGVKSFGGQTGVILVDSTNSTDGQVKFTMSGQTLTGAVNGLASAAYEKKETFENAGAAANIKSVIDEYTINGEKISTSPYIDATEIYMKGKSGDTIAGKISAIDKNITTDTTKAYLVGKTESGTTTLSNSTLKSTNEYVYTESGNLYAAGFYETSDETLKWFTGDIPVDFEALKSIPKQYFIWRNRETPTNIGTSAQKVQKVYPELVSESDGHLTVDYAKLSIVALKAIDVLNERIETLENEIKELKGK